jgi:hypothetical protein
MSFAKHPSDLVDSARSGDLVPFVGAGLSIPCGGLSWDEILKVLIADLGRAVGYEDLMDEVRNGLAGVPGLRTDLIHDIESTFSKAIDPLMVAQVYENVFKRRSLINILLDSCRRIRGPSSTHDLLVSLGCQVYVTTNFDDLIEQAISRTGAVPRVVVKEEDVAYWNSGMIQVIKMHGSLVNPFEPDSVVFSRSDFEGYSIKHPSLDMLIQFLMSTGTLLLLGYSARDPNFLVVHDRVRYHLKRHKRQAYLVSFDMPDAVQDYWKEYGLYPISLDGASKVSSLLTWLSDLKALI